MYGILRFHQRGPGGTFVKTQKKPDAGSADAGYANDLFHFHGF